MAQTTIYWNSKDCPRQLHKEVQRLQSKGKEIIQVVVIETTGNQYVQRATEAFIIVK